MAQKRMFNKKITETDNFLDMPLSTQCLYFHLNMNADDDGFVDNYKRISKMINATNDDYKLLIAKQYLIEFDSGICIIRHWKMHNYISKDRYKSTIYYQEKEEIKTDKNSLYTKRIQNVYVDKNRIDKNRIDKNRIDKNSKEQVQEASESLRSLSGKPDDTSSSLLKDIIFIIDYLNLKINSNYRYQTNKTQSLIKSRLNEDFNVNDFKIVIDKKVGEWKNTDMEKYIRPETLFGNKFESYLNQNIISKEDKKGKIEEMADVFKEVTNETKATRDRLENEPTKKIKGE